MPEETEAEEQIYTNVDLIQYQSEATEYNKVYEEDLIDFWETYNTEDQNYVKIFEENVASELTYEGALEDQFLRKLYDETVYREALRTGVELDPYWSQDYDFNKWMADNPDVVREIRDELTYVGETVYTSLELSELEDIAEQERKLYDKFMEIWATAEEEQREAEEERRRIEDEISLEEEQDMQADIEAWLKELEGGTRSQLEEEERIIEIAEFREWEWNNTEYEDKLQEEERQLQELQNQALREQELQYTYDELLAANVYKKGEIELELDRLADESAYESYQIDVAWYLDQLKVQLPPLYRELKQEIEYAKFYAKDAISLLEQYRKIVMTWSPEYRDRALQQIEYELSFIASKGYSYNDEGVIEAWNKINDATDSVYGDIENVNSKLMERYALEEFWTHTEYEKEEEKADTDYLGWFVDVILTPWVPKLEIVPQTINIARTAADQVWIYVSGDGWKQDIVSVYTTAEDYYNELMRKIEWYKSQASHVPEQLRWIPAIINILDDAQDMLITALYLARPFLKKVFTRPIPVVGWALTANDLLNLSTNALAGAMTPGLIKPSVLYSNPLNDLKIKGAERYNAYIKSKVGFRSRLSFALQGLQVSDTLTGYGLQLGGVMGALSDTTWATLGFMWDTIKPYGITEEEGRLYQMGRSYLEATEASQNLVDQVSKAGTNLWDDLTSLIGLEIPYETEEAPVIYEGLNDFFGEDRSTKEFKAMRMLLQFPQLPNFAHWLQDDDLIKIIAAQRIATGIFYDIPATLNDKRADIITMLPFPIAKPANPVSRQALKDSGIDIANAIPAVKTPQKHPTVGHVMDAAFEKQESFERTLRSRADRNPKLWSIIYNLWREAGYEILEKTLGLTESKDLEYPSFILVPAMLADYNLQLTPPYTDDDLRVWWLGAQREADVSGRDYPRRQDWINSALKNNLKWQNKV